MVAVVADCGRGMEAERRAGAEREAIVEEAAK